MPLMRQLTRAVLTHDHETMLDELRKFRGFDESALDRDIRETIELYRVTDRDNIRFIQKDELAHAARDMLRTLAAIDDPG